MTKKNIVIICLILASLFLYWIGSQFAEQLLVWLNVPATGKSIWQATSSQDYLSWFYIHGPALLIAVLALVVALRNQSVMNYMLEAVGELQKVTYPAQKETSQSAVAVVLIVGVCVLILGFYDYFWQNVVLFLM